MKKNITINLCGRLFQIDEDAYDLLQNYIDSLRSHFARQAEGHVKKGDIFIGISTSGNSENVYRAQKMAKSIGATTACLVGKDGGKIAKEADYPIIVHNQVTARVQECHINIIHILCELSEAKLSEL